MDEVKLTFIIEPDGPSLTARCPELGVASCGEDVPDAIYMLADAIVTYLDECAEVEGYDRWLTIADFHELMRKRGEL